MSEKSAATEAAKSVSDAVKRVADAAVAEIQKVPVVADADLRASGTPGGRITVVGQYFGPGGTLTVNGVQIYTREWSTTRIVGDLPANAVSGEVVVHVDDKLKKRGRIVL